MTKTRHSLALVALQALLVLCLFEGGYAALYKKVPGREDPLTRPQPNSSDLLHVNFDNGTAKDNLRYENHFRLWGKPKLGVEGRFGKGIRFHGGKDGMVLPELKAFRYEPETIGLTVEFNLFIHKLPRKAACLTQVFTQRSNRPSLQVMITPDGKLDVKCNLLERTLSSKPLAVGKWMHVVYQDDMIFTPNGSAAGEGLRVLIDGNPVLAVYRKGGKHFFSAYNIRPETIVFANKSDSSAGLNCSLDEIRICNKNLKYYETEKQSFLDANKGKTSKRTAPYFRAFQDEVFHASFEKDRDWPAKIIVKEEDSESDDDDLNLNAAPDLDNKLIPGVRGKALVMTNRQSIALPKPVSMGENGTIELWVQPVDWDNFTVRVRPEAKVQYKDTNRHILSMYARGSEEPVLRLQLTQFLGSDFGMFERLYGVNLQPYRWRHLLVTWGPGSGAGGAKLFIDGKLVTARFLSGSACLIKPELLNGKEIVRLELGDHKTTVIDELRIYRTPMLEVEIRNAFASDTGGDRQRIGNSIAKFDYRYSRGTMRVDLWPAIKEASNVVLAEGVFELPGGKRISARFEKFKNWHGLAALTGMARLPEGKYPLRGTYFNKAGESLGKFEAIFERVPLPWKDNRLGYSEIPPPPYTSVKRMGDEIHVVGRRYRLGERGHFRSIEVKGKEILAAEITQDLSSGSDDLKHGETKFIEENANEVEWVHESASKDLTLKQKVRFEYDGMAKYEITLAPKRDGVEVNHWRVSIPLKREYGEFLHALPTDGHFRAYSKAGRLHGEEGLVWDSKRFTSHPNVKKKAAGNFIPMVWLGGRLRGFCFFADNDKGWVPHADKPAITITRSKDRATLTLNLIAAPHVLKAPRTVTFGLMTTPAKPLPKDRRVWNRGNVKDHPKIAGPLTSNDTFRPWLWPARESSFDHFPKNYDWETAKRYSDIEREGTPRYPKGSALFIYHDKAYVRTCREDDYFQWPNQTWSKEKENCFVWYMHRWYSRGIYDGIYIDDTFPKASSDAFEGAAYTLPDGRVQTGNSLFGYRRYLKRMYNVMCTLGMRPLITTHMSHTLHIPFHSFVTYAYDGEDSGRFRNTKHTFLDAWPLDYLLTLDNAERTGLVTLVMCKMGYATREQNPKHFRHMVRKTWRSWWGAVMLFDWNNGGPIGRIDWKHHSGGGKNELRKAWQSYTEIDVKAYPFTREEGSLVKALDIKHVEKGGLRLPIGYWKKEEKDRIAKDPLRFSVYRKKDGILFVALNFLKSKIKTKVRVDFASLGLSAAQVAKLKVQDVDDWEKFTGQDSSTIKKPVLSELKNDEDALGDLKLEDEVKEIPKDYNFHKNKELSFDILGHDFRVFEFNWSGKGVALK